MEEICGKRKLKKYLITFTEKKGVDDTMKHCKAIGGEMAVARDNNTLREMMHVIKPFTNKSVCGHYFYSGYTDRDEKGVWRDVNTNTTTTEWWQWKRDEPNNKGGNQHYTDFYFQSGEIGDEEATEEYCPICQVPKMIAFNLQGVCKSSYIDRFYVLQSDKELLGFMQNKMIWREEKKRWEVNW